MKRIIYAHRTCWMGEDRTMSFRHPAVFYVYVEGGYACYSYYAWKRDLILIDRPGT